jgi:hypothetical protein
MPHENGKTNKSNFMVVNFLDSQLHLVNYISGVYTAGTSIQTFSAKPAPVHHPEDLVFFASARQANQPAQAVIGGHCSSATRCTGTATEAPVNRRLGRLNKAVNPAAVAVKINLPVFVQRITEIDHSPITILLVPA